jgi:hypothetical protein
MNYRLESVEGGATQFLCSLLDAKKSPPNFHRRENWDCSVWICSCGRVGLVLYVDVLLAYNAYQLTEIDIADEILSRTKALVQVMRLYGE